MLTAAGYFCSSYFLTFETVLLFGERERSHPCGTPGRVGRAGSLRRGCALQGRTPRGSSLKAPLSAFDFGGGVLSWSVLLLLCFLLGCFSP